MARELGKIKTADLLQNAYKVLGIKINSASNAGGAFAVNYTTIQQAKDNLINLIMTRKGERVHQPEFGCDIWKILFEPIVFVYKLCSGFVLVKSKKNIIVFPNIIGNNNIFVIYVPHIVGKCGLLIYKRILCT